MHCRVPAFTTPCKDGSIPQVALSVMRGGWAGHIKLYPCAAFGVKKLPRMSNLSILLFCYTHSACYRIQVEPSGYRWVLLKCRLRMRYYFANLAESPLSPPKTTAPECLSFLDIAMYARIVRVADDISSCSSTAARIPKDGRQIRHVNLIMTLGYTFLSLVLSCPRCDIQGAHCFRWAKARKPQRES